MMKFVGCYDQAGYQAKSEESEDDRIKTALRLYSDNTVLNKDKKFTYSHSWYELRHTAKWQSTMDEWHRDSTTHKR